MNELLYGENVKKKKKRCTHVYCILQLNMSSRLAPVNSGFDSLLEAI